MKASVNKELCTGCGLCAQSCPEVFQLAGDKAKVLVGTVPKDKESCCKQAADDCPVNAISVQ